MKRDQYDTSLFLAWVFYWRKRQCTGGSRRPVRCRGVRVRVRSPRWAWRPRTTAPRRSRRSIAWSYAHWTHSLEVAGSCLRGVWGIGNLKKKIQKREKNSKILCLFPHSFLNYKSKSSISSRRSSERLLFCVSLCFWDLNCSISLCLRCWTCSAMISLEWLKWNEKREMNGNNEKREYTLLSSVMKSGHSVPPLFASFPSLLHPISLLD